MKSPGVCLLCPCSEVQGGLLPLHQRVKPALPWAHPAWHRQGPCEVPLPVLCALPPCQIHHALLQGDIGGSAQGYVDALPQGSPRHREWRQQRETDGLCGAGRWKG